MKIRMDYDVLDNMTMEELADWVDHKPITEMQKLMMLLDIVGMEYNVRDNEHYIRVYKYGEDGYSYTVIMNEYSYGGKHNLLEIWDWGFNWDDVIGYLRGADAFEIIISDLESRQQNQNRYYSFDNLISWYYD